MKKIKYINLAIILSLIMALTLAACGIDIDGIIGGIISGSEDMDTNPSSQDDASNPSQSGNDSQTSEIDEVPTLAEQEETAGAFNGKYVYYGIVSRGEGNLVYMYDLLDGVPQPMGTHMDTFANAAGVEETYTETTLAYMLIEGVWEPAPHFWPPGVYCPNCFNLDIGAHPWSGEWGDLGVEILRGDLISFLQVTSSDLQYLVPLEEWEELKTEIVP